MDFNINNMKKIITLIIIICTTTLIQAQGDLVFNKALILELSFTDITVPEGKVWKVQGTNGGAFVSVNNSSFNLYQGLWMPEGFTFSKASSGSQATAVNVLEFNVVPTSSLVSSNSGFTGVSSHIDTYYFNEEFLISNGDGGRLVDLNSITVPEGQMWKVIYAFRTRISVGEDSKNTIDISADAVLIDDMLFKDERNEFWLESGGHSVKFKATQQNEKNKIVIKALIYDIN